MLVIAASPYPVLKHVHRQAISGTSGIWLANNDFLLVFYSDVSSMWKPYGKKVIIIIIISGNKTEI